MCAKAPAYKFASQHSEFTSRCNAIAKTTLAAQGFNTEQVDNALATGLGFFQILQLVFQFMGTYGPQTLSIITDVATALASVSTGDPAAIIGAIEAIALKDGPSVYVIAKAIAAMFGIALPTILMAKDINVA